ncbi:MAG: hypothetical protein RL531_1178 [Actinomycetota bacterium]|jgi:predicted nucleic acid-binding protein
MTSSTEPQDAALAIERARSAATLAALHDELDAAEARSAAVAAELEATRIALTSAEARAASAEREVAGLRSTRAVRWATRLRAVFGR